jgi:hypothetical protein
MPWLPTTTVDHQPTAGGVSVFGKERWLCFRYRRPPAKAVEGARGRASGQGGWGAGGGDSRQRRFFWTTPEAPTEHPSCGRRVRATTKQYLKPAVKNPATNQGLGPSKAAWKILGPTTGVWPPAGLFSRAAPRAPPPSRRLNENLTARAWKRLVASQKGLS